MLLLSVPVWSVFLCALGLDAFRTVACPDVNLMNYHKVEQEKLHSELNCTELNCETGGLDYTMNTFNYSTFLKRLLLS